MYELHAVGSACRIENDAATRTRNWSPAICHTRRAAANLHELVNFYNQRFQMNLTEEQKEDLVAFLNSLRLTLCR
jgi:hypothetical protein